MAKWRVWMFTDDGIKVGNVFDMSYKEAEHAKKALQYPIEDVQRDTLYLMDEVKEGKDVRRKTR